MTLHYLCLDIIVYQCIINEASADGDALDEILLSIDSNPSESTNMYYM